MDQQTTAPKRLLMPSEETAVAFGISIRSLFAWRADGAPFIKVGAKILFDPVDLMAWAKTRFGCNYNRPPVNE
jgi:hypothetical protein